METLRHPVALTGHSIPSPPSLPSRFFKRPRSAASGMLRAEVRPRHIAHLTTALIATTAFTRRGSHGRAAPRPVQHFVQETFLIRCVMRKVLSIPGYSFDAHSGHSRLSFLTRHPRGYAIFAAACAHANVSLSHSSSRCSRSSQFLQRVQKQLIPIHRSSSSSSNSLLSISSHGSPYIYLLPLLLSANRDSNIVVIICIPDVTE